MIMGLVHHGLTVGAWAILQRWAQVTMAGILLLLVGLVAVQWVWLELLLPLMLVAAWEDEAGGILLVLVTLVQG